MYTYLRNFAFDLAPEKIKGEDLRTNYSVNSQAFVPEAILTFSLKKIT